MRPSGVPGKVAFSTLSASATSSLSTASHSCHDMLLCGGCYPAQAPWGLLSLNPNGSLIKTLRPTMVDRMRMPSASSPKARSSVSTALNYFVKANVE